MSDTSPRESDEPYRLYSHERCGDCGGFRNQIEGIDFIVDAGYAGPGAARVESPDEESVAVGHQSVSEFIRDLMTDQV